MVSPSKNPWNKNKKKKATKQTQPKTTNLSKPSQSTKKQETESWPDLKLGAKMNSMQINMNSNELPIATPIEPASNYNNTSGSTPNIKYKSKQDELMDNGMHSSNGHYNV